MSDISFNIQSVDEKPTRKYQKGSKYDPILNAFIDGSDSLVTVSVEGKDANYLRIQLTKRVDTRDITNVKVSVVNNVTYLEKV